MEKKVIFITGTNSGFGYLTAKAAAEKGYTVYATIKDTEGSNKERADELKPLGIDAVLIQPGAFPTEIFGKTAFGSDQSVNEGYGELANVPKQINAGMGQMFEAVNLVHQ